MKKTLMILIAVLVVLAFLIPTMYEWETEPPSWHKFGGLSPSKSLHIVRGSYNFSDLGNRIEMGYSLFPGGNNVVINYTGYSSPIAFSMTSLWLQNYSLSFPYTSINIQIGSLVISSNHTLLKNIPNFNDNNIVPYFGKIMVRYEEKMVTILLDFQVLSNESTVAEAAYNGTYQFNMTLTFTPVFEIGHYYLYGHTQTINYSWVETIIV